MVMVTPLLVAPPLTHCMHRLMYCGVEDCQVRGRRQGAEVPHLVVAANMLRGSHDMHARKAETIAMPSDACSVCRQRDRVHASRLRAKTCMRRRSNTWSITCFVQQCMPALHAVTAG